MRGPYSSGMPSPRSESDSPQGALLSQTPGLAMHESEPCLLMSNVPKPDTLAELGCSTHEGVNAFFRGIFQPQPRRPPRTSNGLFLSLYT